MNIHKLLPLTETTYYILLALTKPAHGYVIMQDVEVLSGGSVKIAAGTLYGAVENLLKQKLIQSVKSDDKRRKVYTLTEAGWKVLTLDYERMKKLVETSRSLIEERAENEKIENIL